jgi:CRISPR-associated protein Cas1
MIKRTIYFGNPAYLSIKDNQLIVKFPEIEKNDTLPEDFKKDIVSKIPIEDIGLLILDNPHITISNALLMSLNENNSAVISCDSSHMPFGLMLPTSSHHAFTEKLGFQLNASLPLKKNLWQQTVISKIENQSAHLKKRGVNTDKMDFFIRQVKSGDTTNIEGRAAAYYWENLFSNTYFIRHRFGMPPNNLLNYGYAILRAIVARALVGSGLFLPMGIHHHNKYNPYCLADDIMEPYRPYVDNLVVDLIEKFDLVDELTPEIKRELLILPIIDIFIDESRSPMMVGMQRTTASLANCFEGTIRKILYPNFI